MSPTVTSAALGLWNTLYSINPTTVKHSQVLEHARVFNDFLLLYLQHLLEGSPRIACLSLASWHPLPHPAVLPPGMPPSAELTLGEDRLSWTQLHYCPHGSDAAHVPALRPLVPLHLDPPATPCVFSVPQHTAGHMAGVDKHTRNTKVLILFPLEFPDYFILASPVLCDS